MELLSPILFYIVSAGLVLAALGVIFAPRIIYSVLFAFVAFIFVAFVYFMLNSPFNAAVQIAIYAVAVSILFVFSVMMTGFNKDKSLYIAIAPRVILAFVGLFLTFLSIAVFVYEDAINEIGCNLLNSNIQVVFDSIYTIASGIYTDYIIALELLSNFLLVAVVGLGVILSFKRGDNQ